MRSTEKFFNFGHEFIGYRLDATLHSHKICAAEHFVKVKTFLWTALSNLIISRNRCEDLLLLFTTKNFAQYVLQIATKTFPTAFFATYHLGLGVGLFFPFRYATGARRACLLTVKDKLMVR